jgi:isopenicillin-N N-acyltransferase-like protein
MARLTVFPDLVRAHCTMVGAWGSATTPEFSDSLVQLRALDWATNSHLQQWPLVTVCYTSGGGAFSTLGWPMFLGALTGMSSSPVGVCEKVFLAYNGTDTRNGIPFTLMLRDILEFDSSVGEALKRMESVKRTCSIWVGVGAPASPEKFTVVQYDREFVRHFNDSNLETLNPQHPQLSDVLYVDKHVQPSHDPCLGSLLQDAHGAITPEMLVRVASVHETGDTHVAVYDFLRMQMLVSNASPLVNNSVTSAYNRAFVRLDMKSLFALQQ